MKGIGKETTEYLQKELQGVIHPWQYKDSDIHIINIESVLSDVLSNWNEEIRFRQGFAINEDKSLNIPTMFVQFNGIFNDKNKYRNFLYSLETKNTIRFKDTNNLFKPNLDFLNRFEQTYNYFYMDECNRDKRTKYLLNMDIENFNSINESARNLLYSKFKEFVKKYPELDSLVYAKIINLDKNILNLLQNFDYCFDNPKIIVENMDDKNFSKHDKYVLLFLYSLGFDIAIFSPKGLKFLDDYKINTITFDCYLNQDVESYDYRLDKEIKKEEKAEIKKIKREAHKEFLYDFLEFISFCWPILVIVVFFIIIGVIVYKNDQVSDIDKMKSIESNMNFDTPTRNAFINVKNPTIYDYPTTDYDDAISTNVSLNKNDKIKVLKENDDWIQFEDEDGDSYYIKREDVRDKYYKNKISSFTKTYYASTKIPIYRFDNTNSKVLSNYEKDDEIITIGYTKEFYQVKKDGKVGFVEKKLVKQDKDDKETKTEKTIEEDNEEDSSGWWIVVFIFFLIFFGFIIFAISELL